ncbi:MAG: NUDIX domain-containing protein [Pseudobdellovibrionaceae bacterium]
MQIQTVAAVIVRNGKILYGKRALWKKVAPGFWSPISGKIEVGESEEQAVVRECLEEIGVKVKPIRKLGSLNTRDKHANIHFWLAEIISGEAKLIQDENSEIGWFTLEELSKLTPIFEEDFELLKQTLSAVE